jgi:hypothetical protein
MTSRWWRRSAARSRCTTPRYELDPRVPPAAAWPERGIVGRIGSGSHAGEPVFAHAFRDREGGVLGGYELCLPVDRLHDTVGEQFTDDGLYDDRVPGSEGGLIDELTRGVDVVWSTDDEADRPLWDAHDADRG